MTDGDTFLVIDHALAEFRRWMADEVDRVAQGTSNPETRQVLDGLKAALLRGPRED